MPVCFSVHAQLDDYIEIHGAVHSSTNGHPIPYVNISIEGEPIGIMTNEEGNFQLNIEPEYHSHALVFSCVGFNTKRMAIPDFLRTNGQTVYLRDTSYQLTEILITSIPAKEIVMRALNNITNNYPVKPYRLEAFYRTAFSENHQYKRLLEAALEVYDEGFDTENGISVGYDHLRKSIDYRQYRWREGANYLASFIYGDFIRNQHGSIRDMAGRWDFSVTGITFHDNDEVFVIKGFMPVQNNYERYQCELYIRIKDYAILQLNYDYWWNPEYFPGILSDNVEFKRSDIHVRTHYREYQNRLYPSYQLRKAKWVIHNKKTDKKLEPIEMEIHDELLVHKIRSNYKRQPEEKIDEYGDIYTQVAPYDRRFWKRYNKPVDTELYKLIKNDLEQDESLEKQFRQDKAEDFMTNGHSN
jgi:hypothetical protein